MEDQSPHPEPVVNAMSIDVEDYFHVSVFDGIVPRSMWPDMESRVVRNTERLLDIFDEFEVRSTFFVLGWVGERHPDLVKRIAVIQTFHQIHHVRDTTPFNTSPLKRLEFLSVFVFDPD